MKNPFNKIFPTVDSICADLETAVTRLEHLQADKIAEVALAEEMIASAKEIKEEAVLEINRAKNVSTNIKKLLDKSA